MKQKFKTFLLVFLAALLWFCFSGFSLIDSERSQFIKGNKYELDKKYDCKTILYFGGKKDQKKIKLKKAKQMSAEFSFSWYFEEPEIDNIIFYNSNGDECRISTQESGEAILAYRFIDDTTIEVHSLAFCVENGYYVFCFDKEINVGDNGFID